MVQELSNYRKQYVFFNGYNSLFLNISCGVPQGSILGPLSLIIYINDLTYVSNHCQFILFADDITILFSYKRFEYILIDFC